MRHQVICQYWQVQCLDTNYNAIPGVKTLHLSVNSKNQMVESIQTANQEAQQSNSGLILKPIGNHTHITIDDKTYEKLKKAEQGLKISMYNQKKRTV